MTFSIIVVCLNAGDKLRNTVQSILEQTTDDYEIIIKDGCSKDQATVAYLESLRADAAGDALPGSAVSGHIRVYRMKDSGIYDAMNQAVGYVRGRYVLFLNCGDSFYDRDVLAKVREAIVRRGDPAARSIFYGDIHEKRTDAQVQSNPVIDDFACYRNLPCHQACFYDAGLLRERAFDLSYAVRADYEHFLWCFYRAGAAAVYVPVTVALYEGGGYSGTKENRRVSKREHRQIIARYLSGAQIRKYRLLMLLTLAPVRTWIAENPATAGLYQKIKRRLYAKPH